MKCVICKGEIEKKGTWSGGNNAQPIAEGRCCDKCDAEKVIPERIRLMIEQQNKKGRCPSCWCCGLFIIQCGKKINHKGEHHVKIRAKDSDIQGVASINWEKGDDGK
jgi:hypothetical protein